MKYDESERIVKDYKKLLDTELINLTLQGDEHAFAAIIHRHENIVAKTVKGMLGDCQEAEDIGQETFIRLYRSLKNFKGDAELSTYVVRIGINLSLNALKKRKKFVHASINDSAKEFIVNDTDDQAAFEKKELLEKALQLIDEHQRSVIVLRLINGYSTKETAKILNLPMGTILSRLSRGQEKLKEILKPIL